MDDDALDVPATTFHLVPRDVWEVAKGQSTYRPEAFESEGFIHCTDRADELLAVGNRYYQFDPRPYLALVIRRERLTSPVVYEDPGRVFPHIYGPLNVDAVDEILDVRRDNEGRFIGLGEG